MRGLPRVLRVGQGCTPPARAALGQSGLRCTDPELAGHRADRSPLRPVLPTNSATIRTGRSRRSSGYLLGRRMFLILPNEGSLRTRREISVTTVAARTAVLEVQVAAQC